MSIALPTIAAVFVAVAVFTVAMLRRAAFYDVLEVGDDD